MVTVSRYLLSVTAAPPFTYQSTLFPPLTLELLVQRGTKTLTLDPLKSVQFCSKPNTQLLACQRAVLTSV